MEIKNKYKFGDKVFYWFAGYIESFEIKAIAVNDEMEVFYSDYIQSDFINEVSLFKSEKECCEFYNWQEEPDYDRAAFESNAGKKLKGNL